MKYLSAVVLMSVISLCGCPVSWAGLMNPHTFWVQAPHVSGFQGVVGADLDLVLQDGVWETLKEKLVDCHIKSWNDFLQRAKMTHLLALKCCQTATRGIK